MYIRIILMLFLGWVALGMCITKRELEELDKQWGMDDEDSEDWHEDTIEWIEKEEARKQVEVDWSNPEEVKLAATKGTDEPQMLFIDIRPEFSDSLKIAHDWAMKWQALLLTGNLKVDAVGIEKDQALITTFFPPEAIPVREFLLAQREVKRVVLNGAEYFPGAKKKKKRNRRNKKRRNAKRMEPGDYRLEEQL
eukprot:TRINITY_DN776195_c0_g1_i1.p1 TRINITY_DN776195_c0_g1~~TRINITY_DN776195_c0_g1_i1.p1  ORF type:complete len:194 (+),score=59.84 TRINITY_DN776195_c0_g1_i1:54-635(+)